MKLPEYLKGSSQQWNYAAAAFGVGSAGVDELWISVTFAVIAISFLLGSLVDGPHLKPSANSECRWQ